MGKLFLPKETHGLWDAKTKSLTVYCGEDAYVGFQGTNAEVEELQFSAWSSNLGECATEVYNEGQGRRSTYIDTSKPGTLQFEASNGEKALAPPITISIRMRPQYRQMAPEGQQDETACWAACLAWWLRVLTDRPTGVAQSTLLNKLGVGLWNKFDGTINPAQLEILVAKNGYRMRCRKIQANQLVDYLGFFPMILGFTASGGFSHMNVLCGYDAAQGTVDTMEPMYPDPIYNGEYDSMDSGNGVPLFFNRTTRDPFVYDGAIRTGLSLDSFVTSPMKGGTFWIGYPQEYDAKM